MGEGQYWWIWVSASLPISAFSSLRRKGAVADTFPSDANSGDSKRMILYGQSSGNDMVQRYSYAYPENSLVRGFIGESGGTPVTNPTSSPNFHNAAQIVGCANLTDTAELACMQQVDPLLLQHAVDAINPDPNRGLFRPIADNITTFTNLTERLEKGLIAKLVSLLVFLSWRQR